MRLLSVILIGIIVDKDCINTKSEIFKLLCSNTPSSFKKQQQQKEKPHCLSFYASSSSLLYKNCNQISH